MAYVTLFDRIRSLAHVRATLRQRRLRLVPDESPLPAHASFVPLPFAPQHRIAVFRDDRYISPAIAAGLLWEPLETAMLSRLLPAARWFLDVGANLGWYTVLAALTLPRGAPIHAFEPEPDTLALLRRTLAQPAFRSVRVYGVAASDRRGVATLYRSSVNRGDHRLGSPPPDGGEEVAVPTWPVGELVYGSLRGPGIIKLDIQGHEPRALAGMRSLLSAREAPPLLMVELWPSELQRCGDDWRHLPAMLARFAHVALLDAQGLFYRGSMTDVVEAVTARHQDQFPEDWYCTVVCCAAPWTDRLEDALASSLATGMARVASDAEPTNR